MTKQGVRNPQTRDPNAARRVSMALDLRAQKVKYEEIAQRCGYGTAQAAHKAVMRELERTISPKTETVRLEELDSLERLEYKCWQRLENVLYEKSMLFAVDRILAIKERRARLMGLDVKTDDMPGPSIIIQEVPAGYLEGPKE